MKQEVIAVEASDTTLLETKKFCVVRRTEERMNGPASQEVILHPGAVAIIAVVDSNHLCLIKNRRIAVGETLVELPAGTLEVGEAPESAAHRELYEETGYRAKEMVPLGECFMSPGILRERMYFFVAKGLSPGSPNLEEDEEIETQIVTRKEAIAMATDGQICDAKTIVGLLLYARCEPEGI